MFRTKRRRVIAGVIVAGVVILVVATTVLASPLSRLLGLRETSVDHACVPARSANSLGVAAGSSLMSMDDAQLEQTLDLTVAGGMSWIRFDVPWVAVEPTRGQLDWAATDRVVEAAHSRGLEILGIVDTTPTWARMPGAEDKEFSMPADPAAFGEFAGLAAQHYRDRIGTWEVWNEPNIVNFAAPAPDVSRYAEMLSAASRAIRAQGPSDVQIVTAGLSPAVDGDDSIAPTTFLDQLYRIADSSAWDAVGIHPYSYPYLPQDKSTASFNTFQQLTRLYGTMKRNGDGAKKLWITEYGAPTGGSSSQRVTAQFQADSIWSAIMAARSSDHFGPFFVYTLRDTGTDSSDVEQNFGLVDSNGTPKPAYDAVLKASNCR